MLRQFNELYKQHIFYYITEMSQESTYFSLIEKVGSSSRYQFIVFICLLVQLILWGSYQQALGILYLQSKPVCPNYLHQTNYKNCQDYVCSLKAQQRIKYYPNIIDSIANSTGELYVCQNSYIVSFFQSTLNIGAIISFLFYSYISDKFGRKFCLILSHITILLGILLILIAGKLYIVSSGLIIYGVGVAQMPALAFILINEQFGQEYRYIVGTAFNTIPCFGALFTGISFQLYPHWRFTIILVLLIPTLISFALSYFVQECQRYLIKRDPLEALKSLRRIAVFNGIQQENIKLEDIQSIENNKNKKQKNKIQYNIQMNPVLCFIVIHSSVKLLLEGPILSIDKLGLDTFTNHYVMQGGELIADLLSFPLKDYPRKRLGYISFTSILLIQIGLSFYNLFCTQCSGYFALIFIFFIRFFAYIYVNMIYFHMMEIFPSIGRGLCFGIKSVALQIFNFSFPYIIKYFVLHNLRLQLIYSAVCVLGIIAIIPLKETSDSELQQEIEQLKITKY